ncbi:MAG: hypothetical protein U5L45_00435 [Saprospiraceae bacterium]|nr:hypothetical protein [Saprospiraceae bacterium]
MTFDEFADRFKTATQNIQKRRAVVALKVAFDLSALVKLRIQTRGEDFNNVSFSPYARRTIIQRKTKGYQTAYVDFTQTGRMFANVLPKITSSNESETTVQITARSATEQAKLKNIKRKRGNILRPSQQEISIVTNMYKTQMLSGIKFF